MSGADRECQGDYLPKISKAFRENPFVSFISGFEGDFREGRFFEATIELACPRNLEYLVRSFESYVNQSLTAFGIVQAKFERAVAQPYGSRVLYKYRISPTNGRTSSEYFAEFTKKVLQKFPRFIEDFYQKNRSPQ